MFKFGELADKKVVQKISADLAQQNINVLIQFNRASNMYEMFVMADSEHKVAIDFFHVVIGVKKPTKVPEEWLLINSIPMGPITQVIIVFCVGIFGLGYLEGFSTVKDLLLYSQLKDKSMREVLDGQFWRVITPIFLHFGFMHIIFNMLWFKDLGKIFEKNFGGMWFILFILSSAAFSNTLQFFSSTTYFGGMSGVLYGLLGFIWAYKIFNQKFSFSIPKSDVTMMFVWFILCLSGAIGNIANMAHGGGLSFGVLFGAIFGNKHSDKDNYKKLIAFIIFSLIPIFLTYFVENAISR